ncbi:hypothetical protein MHYP_G00100990 [Metynnis hypsauchen]
MVCLKENDQLLANFHISVVYVKLRHLILYGTEREGGKGKRKRPISHGTLGCRPGSPQLNTQIPQCLTFSLLCSHNLPVITSHCYYKHGLFLQGYLLTKPVAGGVSAGITGIAKTPRKVVEGAVEANTDDVCKAIGAAAAGVAGGAVGVMKAVVDTSVDIVKGVTEGFEEAKAEVDGACTEEDKVMALVDVLTTPVAGGVSAGIKTIAQTPRKVVAGFVEGLEAVIDE